MVISLILPPAIYIVRVSDDLNAVSKQLIEIRGMLKERIDDHEARLREIERRGNKTGMLFLESEPTVISTAPQREPIPVRANYGSPTITIGTGKIQDHIFLIGESEKKSWQK